MALYDRPSINSAPRDSEEEEGPESGETQPLLSTEEGESGEEREPVPFDIQLRGGERETQSIELRDKDRREGREGKERER